MGERVLCVKVPPQARAVHTESSINQTTSTPVNSMQPSDVGRGAPGYVERRRLCSHSHKTLSKHAFRFGIEPPTPPPPRLCQNVLQWCCFTSHSVKRISGDPCGCVIPPLDAFTREGASVLIRCRSVTAQSDRPAGGLASPNTAPQSFEHTAGSATKQVLQTRQMFPTR